MHIYIVSIHKRWKICSWETVMRLNTNSQCQINSRTFLLMDYESTQGVKFTQGRDLFAPESRNYIYLQSHICKNLTTECLTPEITIEYNNTV